jgi:hypothetical protein
MAESDQILFARINQLLERSDGLTARQLARALEVSKRDVNQVLYRNIFQFDRSEDKAPVWSKKGSRDPNWTITTVD